MKKQAIILSDININTEYRVREINEQIINTYADGLRQGVEFPLIVIDQNNDIIEGNHRYKAMLKCYSPTKKIEVLKHEFKDIVDRLKYAAGCNQKNGFRMSTYDEKRLWCYYIEF